MSRLTRSEWRGEEIDIGICSNTVATQHQLFPSCKVDVVFTCSARRGLGEQIMEAYLFRAQPQKLGRGDAEVV